MIQIGFIPNLNSGKYYTATYGAIYYQVNQTTTTTLLEKNYHGGIWIHLWQEVSILFKFTTPFLAAAHKKKENNMYIYLGILKG